MKITYSLGEKEINKNSLLKDKMKFIGFSFLAVISLFAVLAFALYVFYYYTLVFLMISKTCPLMLIPYILFPVFGVYYSYRLDKKEVENKNKKRLKRFRKV